MQYLTVEQVLFVHYRIIEETGGSHGLRDTALLQSAISRPLASFGQDDLYPDLFAKAAALMQGIIKNHPFVDGNKRTAIASAAIFLERNGYDLTASNKELETFTIKTASGNSELSKIADWFKKNSEKV